jgi:hypothetical protein
MNLTKNQKLLILAGVVLVVVYFIYFRKENATSVPSESVSESDENLVDESDENLVDESENTKSVVLETDKTMPKAESDNLLLKKMTSKNSAKDGQYKDVSYARGDRFGGSQDLNTFFEQGDPLNASENANFLPNDTSASLASYSGKPCKGLCDDEKFNASALLPKEERQDWFEDVTPQKIKNRHLINIYRPIGVNTVITSRKNGSLDLRGNPVNPKTFVSPFLNSSIEPDVNARGICT